MDLRGHSLKSSEEHIAEIQRTQDKEHLDEEVSELMTRVLEGEATFLSRIKRGKVMRPRRTTLFGVRGIGKSTWASMSPEPIFLPTEEGANEIECAKFPLFRSFPDIMSALKELWEGPHEFKTVVVDTLDWLEVLVWDQVCKDHDKKDIEDFGYAKGYTHALSTWRQFLDALDTLRNDRGMAIILLAHSKIERFESPDTASYDRYTPKLHKSAAGLIQEWSDEVFFACYQIFTRQEKGKFNKDVAKAIGGDERIIRTVERPFSMGKNRIVGLPPEIPLDYRVYSEKLAELQI